MSGRRPHRQPSKAGELTPNPTNPRRASAAALARLGRSLTKYGDLSGIVFNLRTGRLIAGHQRLTHIPPDAKIRAPRAATKPDARGTVREGYLEMPDGRTWAYREVDVDERREREMNLAANTQAGEWDDELLGASIAWLKDRGADLSAAVFDPALLAAVNGGGGADEEELPPPPVPKLANSKEGTLYELGPHRLYVADAFEQATFDALDLGKHKADLVVTDPPYAIYGSSSGVSVDVADDSMVRPFFLEVLRLCKTATREFAHIYVFCDWRSWASWWEMAKRVQTQVKNCIVWDKGSSGLGNNYANTHEFVCFLSNLRAAKALGQPGRTGQRPVLKPNLIRADRASGDDRHHNAAKPASILAQLIENSSEPGELVADFFGGSGSTLLACERLGRRCVMVEKDTKWADVIRQRYADLVEDPRWSPTKSLTPKAVA